MAERRGVPLRTILTTVGVVVAVYLAGKLIYKLRDIILLVVVAGFVALILDPFVAFLQRHVVQRRGSAVALVTIAAILVFAGLATAFGYPLVNGLTHLADNLPKYVHQAEQGKGWIGSLVRKYHVQHWVEQNAPKLTSFAKNLSKPALSLGKGALSLVIALFAIFMMVLLMLLEAPKMRRGMLRFLRPEHAATMTRVAGEVSRSVSGYMVGNFITSVIAGVVVFVTLASLGVPFALLWALWVAMVDFLPMIGGALAGIPTVLFAAATKGLVGGVVTLVVFLVYTQLENHVLNPVVMSRTVRINPLLVLLAILVGAEIGNVVGGLFGGFVGTLLAIPFAGSIQVVVRELWQASAPTAGIDPLGRGETAGRGEANVPPLPPVA